MRAREARLHDAIKALIDLGDDIWPPVMLLRSRAEVVLAVADRYALKVSPDGQKGDPGAEAENFTAGSP
jgi:hypothetical protein